MVECVVPLFEICLDFADVVLILFSIDGNISTRLNLFDSIFSRCHPSNAEKIKCSPSIDAGFNDDFNVAIVSQSSFLRLSFKKYST